MLVSVLLCAYNAEKHIREAIESVLHQTFSDFELIIVDDGSTDNTFEIVQSFKNPRIRLTRNEHSYIDSLNAAIELANGELLFHMDADDIMHPERIRIQTNVMRNLPNVDVCGSWMISFTQKPSSENLVRSLYGYIERPELHFILNNFIFHPTVCMRKSSLENTALRYKKYNCAEDYKLWVDLALKGKIFYIIDYPLMYYRIHELQVSRKKEEMQHSSEMIQEELITSLLLKYAHAELHNFHEVSLNMLRKNLIGRDLYLRIMAEMLGNTFRSRLIDG